jgi:alkylation response protein AidB-like acyl-CoA dehydrogenase
MDFSLEEEQVALRDLARQILEDQLTPDHLRELESGPEWIDRKLWAELARANLLGLAISEKYGGMGLGFFEVCLLLEEIGRTVAPLPVLPTLVMGALPIAEFGSPSQQDQFLAPVASGEIILSAALVEEGTNEPTRPLTLARKHGSGWRLDGIKTCVPVAHLAERILVSASCDAGVGLFLIDPKAEAVKLEPQETTNGEPQFRITLSGAEVDETDLIGGVSRGAEIVKWLSQRVIAALASTQVGVSERALRMTASYTSEREQFNRPIATFQAVAQRAANCYVDVEALRLVAQQAAWRLSEGLDAGREVAIAKYWAGDTGHRVSYAAQHLHGGIGVDMDYPLHRYCLWSKQIELTLGSSTEKLVELGARLAEGRP